MVTEKELASFKETLTTALQKAGYIAYGRISSPAKTYKFYAHLPEQEMISQYVEDNNLDEINRVYRVIKFINDNSGNYYSLKTLCKDHDIDYKIFAHAVENLPYIDKTGRRRKTKYQWIHEEEPSFNTAKDFVEHIRKLKVTKLNKSLKDKIRQAVAEGISKDDFFKANKIKKEATYSVDAYFTYQKLRQPKKDEPGDETLVDNVILPESLTNIPERDLQEYNNQENVKEESVIKDDIQSQPEDHEEAGLQMENFTLKQEVKYLKKINKAKDKLIKALRKKV